MDNQGQVRGKRRTREQWRTLVMSWRRSGKSVTEFAVARGVAEGGLRWWAWRLARDGEVEVAKTRAMTMVPVRVVDEVPDAVCAVDDDRVAPVWTLRTSRGEVRVFTSDAAHELRAAIAALVGGSS